MRMPSFSAFSSLLGPMFSPARMKLVFLEMLPTFFASVFLDQFFVFVAGMAGKDAADDDGLALQFVSVVGQILFSGSQLQAGLLQAFDQGTVFLVGEIQPDALGYLLSDFVHMDQIIKCGLCEGINGSKGFGNFLGDGFSHKTDARAKSTLS